MSHTHRFMPSETYKHYEYCIDCGSYHSLIPVNPVEMYEGDYWDGDLHNTPDHQKINMLETETREISKADFVMQFVPRGQTALEVGCFPGVILDKLRESGYEQVYGIEPNKKYIDYILGVAQKSTIINGYFPEITQLCESGTFDCVVAVDVLEHIEDYDSFIKEIHRLLRRGGTAIIMSPIILEDGKFRERDFLPEHVWIFSKKFLDPYLKEMFYEVEWKGRWVLGHEVVTLKK